MCNGETGTRKFQFIVKISIYLGDSRPATKKYCWMNFYCLMFRQLIIGNCFIVLFHLSTLYELKTKPKFTRFEFYSGKFDCKFYWSLHKSVPHKSIFYATHTFPKRILLKKLNQCKFPKQAKNAASR